MRDTQCQTCALNNSVVASCDTLEKCFEHFKMFATTWHALLHLTRIATHPQAHCYLRVLPSLARQIACHGVNPCRASVRLA